MELRFTSYSEQAIVSRQEAASGTCPIGGLAIWLVIISGAQCITCSGPRVEFKIRRITLELVRFK